MIRDATTADAQQIAEIYNYNIEETDVKFENDGLKKEDMENRIDKKKAKDFPFIVCEQDWKIAGYS